MGNTEMDEENTGIPAADLPTRQKGARLIVADDEESMRFFLQRSLRRHGHDVEAVASGDQAIELYESQPFDVAIVDLKMPGADGIEVLKRIRTANPEGLVIIMTAYGTIRSAVEAMWLGAFDYITKPFEIEELLLLINRALTQRATLRENRELRKIIDNRRAYGGLIGQSQAMRKIYQRIDMLNQSASTVLIQGESGTGKELLAHAIHKHSPKAEGPFVPLDCAALPETLLESELFGHVAGAFTGALKAKRGIIERARNGTLFIDEISEVSQSAQIKLLRFLQERTFTPVGAAQPVKVDVRVIAATNRDLVKKIGEGTFRQDLFWRLNVVPVALPPLRQRREDVSILAAHFLERFNKVNKGKIKGFTLEAMIVLSNYTWPGNVRELENVIERMVVFNASKDQLDLPDIPQEIRDKSASSATFEPGGDPAAFQEALKDFERNYLSTLLNRTRGNISQAARLSGISRSQIHQKLKRLDLDPIDFRV